MESVTIAKMVHLYAKIRNLIEKIVKNMPDSIIATIVVTRVIIIENGNLDGETATV